MKKSTFNLSVFLTEDQTFKDSKQVEFEMKTGFVYTDYITYKFMNEYSSHNGTLKEFLTQITTELGSK